VKNCIYVQLKGGLGNQMFQYAAGFGLSSKLGCQLKLDCSKYNSETDRAYMLDRLQFDNCIASPDELTLFDSQKDNILNRLINQVMRSVNADRVKTKGHIYTQPGFYYDKQIWECIPPVLLKGYFQSEKFFIDAATKLRSQFMLREAMSSNSVSILNEIASCAHPVSLHVRSQDYISSQKTHELHGVCSLEYYKQALKIVEALSEDEVCYFIFSDDTNYAKKILSDVPRCIFVMGNDSRPWEDITLMAACRDHIIANSSFSWWGAWLNTDKEKIVVAPRNWFRRKKMIETSTVDLYPDSWITL